MLKSRIQRIHFKLLFFVNLLSRSGLGLQFDSSIPHLFRTNIISCLIDRAFKICSTELAFTLELKFLKQFFLGNNFPINFIEKCFKKTINFIYNGKTSYATVPKKPINIKLPFLDPLNLHSQTKIICPYH